MLFSFKDTYLKKKPTEDWKHMDHPLRLEPKLSLSLMQWWKKAHFFVHMPT